MPELKIRPGQIGGGSNAEGSAVPVTVPGQFNVDLSPVADLAATRREIEEESLRRKDGLAAAKAQGEFKRRVEEDLNLLDPLTEDYENQVFEVLRDTQQEVMDNAGIETAGASASLAQILTQMSEGRRTMAAGERLDALSTEGERVFLEAKDEVLAKIRQDPGGADAYLAEFSVTAGAAGEAIQPARLRELQNAFADAAILAEVEGIALDGDIAGAQKFLKDNEGDLTPEQARNGSRLIQEIKNRNRQDFLTATARSIADLELQIVEAGGTDDLAAARDKVRDLDSRGFFEDRQGARVALVKAIESKRKALVKGNTTDTQILANYTAGLGAANQKEADRQFSLLTAGMEPQEQSAFVSAFVEKTGFAPTPVKRFVQAAERAAGIDAPLKLLEAHRLHDALVSINPTVDTGAGDRVKLMSTLIDDAGMAPEAAAQFVIDNPAESGVIATRKTLVKDERKDWLADNDIEDITDLDDLPPEASAEFTRKADTLYLTTGDYDIAAKTAAKDIRRKYGVSGSSQGQVVAYPPENLLPPIIQKAFPDPDDRTEIIFEDLGQALRDAGIETDEHEFFLVPDARTKREIESGVRRPSYRVMFLDADGFPVPLSAVDPATGATSFPRYEMPGVEELRKIERVEERLGRGDQLIDEFEREEDNDFVTGS